MRSRVLVPLLVALCAPPLAAQRPVAKEPAGVAALLIRNEDGWTDALVRRDTAYFQRTLAPGFVYTEDAKLMSRRDVIESAVAPGDTVTAAHNEGMVVHRAGPVTAVVTGVLVVQGRSSGVAWTHRYRFTDTWVRLAGRWQIVAAQDYLIPAASGS